ncbi:winged helix family transcriptional regulator [Kocuria rhizophila]|nr:winged helix family transcriptional regulator [Kocuria rhizophila]
MARTFGAQARPQAQAVLEAAAQWRPGLCADVGVDDRPRRTPRHQPGPAGEEIRQHIRSTVPSRLLRGAALRPGERRGQRTGGRAQRTGDPTFTDPVIEPLTPLPACGAGSRIDHQRVGVLIDPAARRSWTGPAEPHHREFQLLNYLVENGTCTVGHRVARQPLGDAEEIPPNARSMSTSGGGALKLGRLANTARTVRGQGYG